MSEDKGQDAFYIGSTKISEDRFDSRLYRTPGMGQLIKWVGATDPPPDPPAGLAKWETSREYYQGTWEGKPAFFKKILRISKDMREEYKFTVASVVKVIAQNLWICRGIPGVPELYAYTDDTVIMEFKPGVTIKQAFYQDLLAPDYVDYIYPQIIGSVGLIRDRMHSHGRIFDLSVNNLLIDPQTDINYFAWVDFDPALRGLSILTIAEFLILLTRKELVFDDDGEMKWNPAIFGDNPEARSDPPKPYVAGEQIEG